MTDSNYTAIQFLIDRSGSMASMAQEAMTGMKNLLDEQRALPGKCTVRISQFDDKYEVVCGSTPIADVRNPDLIPRSMTALLDAWGRAITEFGAELAAMPEDERPENVIFVTITDGLENASKEWDRARLMAKVTEQTDKYGWKFLYLGANQDAVAVGASYGVARGQTMTYAPTAHGNAMAYAATSRVIGNTRSGVADSLTDES